MPICSRSVRRTISSGSTSSARSGRFSTSSRTRASNFDAPTTPTLRPKLRKVPRKVVFDGDGLRLKQLAMGSAGMRSFWLRSVFDMYRAIKSRPHHLRHATCIVAVGLADLRLQHAARMCARLHADHRQPRLGKRAGRAIATAAPPQALSACSGRLGLSAPAAEPQARSPPSRLERSCPCRPQRRRWSP